METEQKGGAYLPGESEDFRYFLLLTCSFKKHIGNKNQLKVETEEMDLNKAIQSEKEKNKHVQTKLLQYFSKVNNVIVHLMLGSYDVNNYLEYKFHICT